MIHLLPKGKIWYHCRDCNNTEDVTALAQYVRQYGLLAGRSKGVKGLTSCLYRAWKVLVLATTEYEEQGRCREHTIIKEAIREYAVLYTMLKALDTWRT